MLLLVSYGLVITLLNLYKTAVGEYYILMYRLR